VTAPPLGDCDRRPGPQQHCGPDQPAARSGASPANVVLGRDLATPTVLGHSRPAAHGPLPPTEWALHQGLRLQRSPVRRAAVPARRRDLESTTARCKLHRVRVAHLINVIYAVATLGILVLVGAVYMIIYLLELRRTGDRRSAVVAASKFHANCNLTALTLILLTLLSTSSAPDGWQHPRTSLSTSAA
jgi:hypothetical protein